MEILIGQSECGDIIMAETKDGKITSLSAYYLYNGDQTYDSNNYLQCVGSGYGTVNGIEYKRGMEIAEDFTPFFEDKKLEEIMIDKDYYEANGHTCSECGTFHDTEQYHNLSFVIFHDCELYCKSCVEADDLIGETPVNDVYDIYKAKDVVGMTPEQFEEVKTIFHDCGWGGHATDHNGAETIVNDLLEEHGELFAGLTGIGQFQVYVTLYKRVA